MTATLIISLVNVIIKFREKNTYEKEFLIS